MRYVALHIASAALCSATYRYNGYIIYYYVMLYHRLNGSSSPVLTATPRSYGRSQNSTLYKIKTTERIGMKFGTVDYVLDISPQNKFGDDRSSGGFWVNM